MVQLPFDLSPPTPTYIWSPCRPCASHICAGQGPICRHACHACHGGITFRAYKEGQSEAAIDFGKKDITCIKDIPEGTTSQLYFVMESFEAAAPSTKDYCEKVRSLFADALNDVFTEAFDEVVTKGTVEKHTFYNLANYPGDRDKVVEQIHEICTGVIVPALSDELKQKALEEYPKMNNLLTIFFSSYDPFVYAPTKSEKEIYKLTISVK